MARKRKREVSLALVSDLTPERKARAGDNLQWPEDKRSPQQTARILTPLERLLARNKISSGQYAAGVKFRHHWYHAGHAGRVMSVDLNNVVAYPSTGSRSELHAAQYREAWTCLGPITSALVEAIVCQERTLEAVAPELGRHPGGYGIDVVTRQLSAALDKLVKLWGI